MSGKKLTDYQAGLALEEIARTARALSSIGLALEGECGDMADGLGIAVRCLAQRAGWIADMVNERVFGGSSSAETLDYMHWSMPPAFFPAGKE